MKISYDWLKEYIRIDLAPGALAEKLTMAGLEVDSLEEIGASLDGVFVGEVLAVREHPNADQLVLCEVNLGDDAENGQPAQIACGAPNVAAGQKVPVATPGTTLLLPARDNPEAREPVTIEARELRGERSEGMICAEDELGLSDDHSGIMVLSEDAEIGQSFDAYLRAQGIATRDTIFDIDLTPNRPDATSHLGVARDVAALTHQELQRPDVDLPKKGGAAAEEIRIDIRAPEACPRYVGFVVRGVEVKDSPAWLKRRLASIGLRPRNNVVDITNYVLHECGQPLHAFDLQRLAGQQIVVRLSEGKEAFTTLDDKERTLPDGTLLICDAEKPVAIAGVMGGANSEVSEETTDILIESAYFDPSTIRRASKALNLSTDSSYRFERGVDRDGQVWAAARAAQLIAELAGGEVVPGVVDEHPRPYTPRELTLRPARANQLLGTELATDDMGALLETVGFEVTREEPLEVLAEHALEGRELEVEEEEMVLHCTAPSFRPDVEREVDLIEEVARLYGYDRIPTPERTNMPTRPPREAPADTLRRRARTLLSGLGFREIYTNSLLPQEAAERFNEPLPGREPGDVAETLKPISQEMAALRPRLLPGLLQVMQHNRNHGQKVLRFFEFGHVFRRTGRDDTDRDDTVIPGYAEHESFILGMSGPHAELGWNIEERPSDFFDLKGVMEVLLETLRLPEIEMRPAERESALQAYHLDVFSADASLRRLLPLGLLARVADDVASDFDLDAPVFVAELDWATCTKLAAPHLERRYVPVPRFPTVERDLAVIVRATQPVGPLLASIREAGAPLLRRVRVFDLYEGQGIPEGKKSVAFRLRFGADRTLQDEEVDAAIEAITKRLQDGYDATLRQ